MTTRLVLVRHGEARAGVDRVVGGPNGCKGLTDRGRRQAEHLRDRLHAATDLAPDVVFASMLPRAIETAEVALPDRVVTRDCDYCELHVGESDGLTMDEYEQRYGVVDAFDPEREWSPGGESPRTFDERVRRATAALIETYRDQTVMLFTHGGFVFAATMYLLGAPGVHERTSWMPPANTSITMFMTGHDGSLVFDRYNDHAHLSTESER